MPSNAYPLSFSQHRLWFLDQLSPGLPHYNVPLVWDIEGPADHETLRRVLEELIRRHEALRTVFDQADGVPYQRILPEAPFDLPVEDLSQLPADQRMARLEPYIERETRRPFNLSTGPVLRAVVVRLSAVEHVLILTVHHIAFDAWSGGVVFREFAALYEAFSKGLPSPLPDQQMRYVDFAVQQRAWSESDACKRQLEYWRQQLRAPRPALSWATDRRRPAVPTHKGHRQSATLPEATVDTLQQLSRTHGVTPFMTFAAAYAAFLHRLTGQDEVIIGTPIANRNRQELEPLVGFFLNSLALRIDCSGNPTFRDLLARTRRVAIEAYANQDVPFDRLVEELNPERALGHTPLAQTFLVVDGAHAGGRVLAVGDLILRRRVVTLGMAKFDAQLAIWRAPHGRRVTLDLSADLFDAATADRMLAQMCELMEHVPHQFDDRISQLSMVGAAAHRALVDEWNRTAVPWPADRTLVDLFTEQVQRAPDAGAVLWRDTALSYRNLQTRVHRLAAELRAHGIGPGARVAVCLDRTPDLIAAVLAILTTGAAYVPLDPAYPPARLRFIADDAGCRVVVTQQARLSLATQLAAERLVVDRLDDTSTIAAPGSAAAPSSLAYVIYTSGSTGTPKGVAIEHRQVVNLITWAMATFAPDERAGMLASTSMSFDLAVFEWFVPLCSGGAVILVDTLLDLPLCPARDRVTFVNSVPSVVGEFLRTSSMPPKVSVVAMAGEPLSRSLVERVYREPAVRKVYDLYGPTETTVYATCALRTADGPDTIGRPIANTSVLVLDEHQQLAAVGAAGELFIGGAGVGRGYLGRDELTRQRFVVDPTPEVPLGRMYRTGDRVRWRSDGTLEFLGRLDRQIKLRGFRIELGEVEAALRTHDGIADAVVIKRENGTPDRVQLVACVVDHSDSTDAAIYGTLEERLPHYMIPTRIARFEALPRLPNGKLDIRTLETTIAQNTASERVVTPPGTQTEQAVARLWCEVLQSDRIGVDDHFFRIGGHSLLATQLVGQLNRQFAVSMDLATVFTAPTIAEQAAWIDSHTADAGAPVPTPLDAGDRELLLEYAGTTVPYPRDASVCRLFEERASHTPDAPALVEPARTLTYADVNRLANQLAHRLLENDAVRRLPQPVAIGIALPRSADAIIAMLAVLKAGGAYVPLDPRLPEARLKALCEHADVRLVIALDGSAQRWHELPRLDIGAVLAERRADGSPNPAITVSPASVAYILFTSGSSGDPKRVAVPHRAIVRLAYGMPDVVLEPHDTVMQLAPLAFDASVFEIWCPLLHGARIAIDPNELVTARSLRAFIAAHHITTMWLTASLFNAVVDEDVTALAGLRQLLTGGEVLSPVHVRQALTALPGLRLFNGYGPTETTTFACLHRIEKEDADGRSAIPIGRPLSNTRVYVLDGDGAFAGVGRQGELWIGGDGVAAGYVGEPALTAERFVADPFAGRADARMYRTGDLARWRRDGVLDFMGRLDDQIKLRGYRIEPAEIEAMLAEHPAVRRSAVVVADRPTTGRALVAFVVLDDALKPTERGALIEGQLRAHLRSRLPEYMVPSAWVALEALPLLPSGKVDRRALATSASMVAPTTASDQVVSSLSALEAQIAAIWQTLLNTGPIDRDANFFDRGGHSLLAMQVVSRIQNAFDVEFDVRAFFLAPTIAGNAKCVGELKSARSDGRLVLPRRVRPEHPPLSYSQQRIWFLQRWYGDVGVYNVPAALKLEGAVDVRRLQRALQLIVDRHESLRTVFPLVDGVPFQRVLRDVTLPFVTVDLTAPDMAAATRAARDYITSEARRRFDLEHGPLIRAAVLQLDTTTTVLALLLHHIVSDGWSMGVLFRELAHLYGDAGASPTLPALPLQYPDFAVWQREYVSGAVLDRDLAYWRQQLRAPIEALEWPLEQSRPDETSARGGRITIEVPQAASRSLARLSSELGATTFMATLAAFQALIHRYTRQRDVLIGTPIAGRTRPDTEGLIGCFINTLVMRTTVSSEMTYRQLLLEARRTSIEAQAHQELPFEVLVDAIGAKRSASRSPLFQVMLVVNDGLASAPTIPGITTSGFAFGFDYAKFDVTLDLRSTATGLRGTLEYNADLFSASFAQQMADDFVALVSQVATRPDEPISSASLAFIPEVARRPFSSAQHAPAMEQASDDVLAVEERLRPLWCRVLDATVVEPGSNFFDLGGTSMLAVRLFADIERDFGVRVPLSSLFRNGTLRGQATLLARHQASSQSWSVLVPLQPLGNRPPLFLVHGIGGEVLSFGALAAALAPNQPVFGLQAEYESPAGDDRLESVAARYIAALRAQAPSGPYFLGGYSSGGIVAYEMAQQLMAAGETVALLAMIDTAAPKVAADAVTPAALWRLVKNAAYWTLDDEFLSSHWAHQRARVSSKLRSLRAQRRHKNRRAAFDAGADVRDLLGLWRVPSHARRFLERYVRMMVAYRPRPYRGGISLMRARTLSLTYLGAEDFGWSQLADRVAVHHVAGSHDTILKEPRVKELAALLSTAVQDALQSTSSASGVEAISSRDS